MRPFGSTPVMKGISRERLGRFRRLARFAAMNVREAHCGPRKDAVNGFASRDLQTVNFNIAAEGT